MRDALKYTASKYRNLADTLRGASLVQTLYKSYGSDFELGVEKTVWFLARFWDVLFRIEVVDTAMDSFTIGFQLLRPTISTSSA